MKIKNINEPTSAFWSKIAVACAAASGSIAGWAYWTDNKHMMAMGGILGVLGVVIPVFVSGGKSEK